MKILSSLIQPHVDENNGSQWSLMWFDYQHSLSFFLMLYIDLISEVLDTVMKTSALTLSMFFIKNMLLWCHCVLWNRFCTRSFLTSPFSYINEFNIAKCLKSRKNNISTTYIVHWSFVIKTEAASCGSSVSPSLMWLVSNSRLLSFRQPPQLFWQLKPSEWRHQKHNQAHYFKAFPTRHRKNNERSDIKNKSQLLLQCKVTSILQQIYTFYLEFLIKSCIDSNWHTYCKIIKTWQYKCIVWCNVSPFG